MPKVDVAEITQKLSVPRPQCIKPSIQELRAKFDSKIKRLDEKNLHRNSIKENDSLHLNQQLQV